MTINCLHCRYSVLTFMIKHLKIFSFTSNIAVTNQSRSTESNQSILAKELCFLTILGQNTVQAVLTLRRAVVATIIFRLWLKRCRKSMTGRRYLPSSAASNHWFLCPKHLWIFHALLRRIRRMGRGQKFSVQRTQKPPLSTRILGG